MSSTTDDDLRHDAQLALERDAGCAPERAQRLLEAVERTAAEEALALVAGTAQIYGGVADARFARVERLIDALPDEEPLPSAYEVGVILRITVSQARSVLRTYEARCSRQYRTRMDRAMAQAKPKAVAVDGKGIWRFSFSDPAVLEYAVETLRRSGLARGLTIDRQELELSVARDARDRLGRDASQILGTHAS